METRDYEMPSVFHESIPTDAKGWLAFFAEKITALNENDQLSAEKREARSFDEKLDAAINDVVDGIFHELIEHGILIPKKTDQSQENLNPEDACFKSNFTMNEEDHHKIAELLWGSVADSDDEFGDSQINEIRIIFQTLDILIESRNYVRELMLEMANAADAKFNKTLTSSAGSFREGVVRHILKTGLVEPFVDATRSFYEASHITSEAFSFPASSSGIAAYLESLGENSGHSDEEFKGMLTELMEALKEHKLLNEAGFIESFTLIETELKSIDGWLTEALIKRYGVFIPDTAEDPLEQIITLIKENILHSKAVRLAAREVSEED